MRNKNIILRGLAASPGLLESNVYIFKNSFEIVDVYSIDNADIEIERFNTAVEEVKKDLLNAKQQLQDKIGEEYKEIFEAQIASLEDAVVIEKTLQGIREKKKNADYIYNSIVNDIINNMRKVNNDFFKDRIYDIKDILNRVLRKLKRKKGNLLDLDKPVVIAAYNLTPGDLVNIDKKMIIGIITETGGITSHFAILARALNIPSVVGIRGLFSKISSDDNIIVDGYSGIIVIDPNESSRKVYKKKKREYARYDESLKQVIDQDAVTLDNRSIEISANIEIIEEIDEIAKYGAKGIGLLRTEFMYMNKNNVADLKFQESYYKKMVEAVFPNSIIIRTVDIGGDKEIFVNKKEINPFLGFRGIRSSLEHRDIFEMQIEAILRASVRKNTKIMLPIVSQVEEIIKTKEIIEHVKKKLKKKKIPFDGKIDIGIMVEVPSCALMADEFAKYVDFFSIGTNDLTQYTLAVDRTNSNVSGLFDHLHPAVLKLIDMTIRSAHTNNIWTGLCGEMASDPVAVPILIGMGIDELSMSPIFIPEIKSIIREMTYKECKIIANEVMTMKTPQHVRKYIKGIIIKKIPNLKKYIKD